MKLQNIASLSLLYLSGGCILFDSHGFLPGFGLNGTRGKVRGVVADEPVSGNFVFVDHSKIVINGQSMVERSRIKAGDWVEINLSSQRAVAIATEPQLISGELFASEAVIGAGLSTGTTAYAQLTSDDPTEVNIQSGWAFFWGIRPRVRGRWASGITESSTVAVQLEDTGSYTERYYLFAGGPMTVTCESLTDAETLNTVNTYVEVTSSAGVCQVSTPAAIPVGPGSLDDTFVIPAKRHAEAAGWVP